MVDNFLVIHRWMLIGNKQFCKLSVPRWRWDSISYHYRIWLRVEASDRRIIIKIVD